MDQINFKKSFYFQYYSNLISSDHDFIEQIINLDREHFPWPWTLQNWQNLDGYSIAVCIDKSTNTHIGFVLFLMTNHSDTAHLLKIVVHPSMRNQQIGFQLLHFSNKNLPKFIQSIFLEVEATNSFAIKMYEKFGFQEINRIKNYYSNGSPAIIFSFERD